MVELEVHRIAARGGQRHGVGERIVIADCDQPVRRPDLVVEAHVVSQRRDQPGVEIPDVGIVPTTRCHHITRRLRRDELQADVAVGWKVRIPDCQCESRYRVEPGDGVKIVASLRARDEKVELIAEARNEGVDWPDFELAGQIGDVRDV